MQCIATATFLVIIIIHAQIRVVVSQKCYRSTVEKYNNSKISGQ